MSKWIAKTPGPWPMDFEIEHDEATGYYLYVYENDFCKYDYLQDTLQFAKEEALEEFGVPLDAWQEVYEESN
jgi:hypothetical protein